MLEDIKTDLGQNYTESTDTLLETIIADMTAIAYSISNRTALTTSLSLLVKEAVKSAYLRRGDEGKTGSSEGSLSSSYEDIQEKLRNDIIKNGLRLLI